MPRRIIAIVVVSSLLAGLPRLPGQEAPSQVHTSRSGTKLLPLPKEEGVWHFVIFGDRTGGPPEGVKVLAQAVTDTNLLDPDLVMTVGDLVQGYNASDRWMAQMREFRGVMEGLKRPWFPVAGNHDIYWRGPGKPPGEHEAEYETHFGPLWYWFGHKTAAFVVLYSDEGDPKTGEKGFSDPKHTQMSPEQLGWLEATLRETAKYEHVFVFLHHPRWITTNYPGSNWDEVHRRLVAAGNVTAVFAGHIHRLRYEGVRDGIEYFAIGATGAEFPHEIPRAGWLHHFAVVTVRPSGIQLATIPVGAVLDPREMTPERHQDVDALLKAGPPSTVRPATLAADGRIDGSVVVRLTNPASRPIEATISADGGPAGVAMIPDHVHVALGPGDAQEIRFLAARDAGPIDERLLRATLSAEIDYLATNCRISLPRRSWPLPLTLDTEALAGVPAGVLALDGRTACVRIAASDAELPDGPFTVEAWVRATQFGGRRPLVSKAQTSEWGLFASEGRPTFIVHLDKKYAEVESDRKIEPGRWHHVAGVFDGQELRLYVDGALAGRTKAAGQRTKNGLPALVGADPDAKELPVDFFPGEIDEVRLSTGARYRGDAFEAGRPAVADEATLVLLHLDRAFGLFHPDAGPKRRLAIGVGAARCTPLEAAGPR